ncbi:MAG: DUF1571 domain-containing protein [Pirellulales bacterium]|nr:DUF1571 domain-containing protein [Pirellulales bacterium]
MQIHHPLHPVLKRARDLLERMETIEDYTCTVVKRERIAGELGDYAWIYLKLRHERPTAGSTEPPLAVYLRFLGPEEVAGREVIYRPDVYGRKMIVRRGGPRFAYVTTSIAPDGDLAMQNSRYPLTEIGLKNMLKRLIEVGEQDAQRGECEVEYFTGSRIDGRTCTAIRVTHPVRRSYFRYHKAEIFLDDELQVPVRFASYGWPEEEGGEPRLLEEYTFTDVHLNVGLTDRDFDYRNPEYGFRKDYQP